MMKSGISIIEVIVATAILTFFAAGVLVASHYELRAVEESSRSGRAAFLLEEGLEAVRIIRDRSWSGNIAPLIPGTTYYPVFSVNWKLDTNDPGLIENTFRRTATIEDVYRRNSDDDIVDFSSPDPHTLDPGTKKVILTITWNTASGASRRESIATYVANIFQN